MIHFFRDKYGTTVYFATPSNRGDGVVIVNGDIQMDLSESMTFDEKVVSVQKTQTEQILVGYSDGAKTITPSERTDILLATTADQSLPEVERQVRHEIAMRTWKEVKTEQTSLVDVPFAVENLQYTDDYRLIPVRGAREGNKPSPVYFRVRPREDWLVPHIIGTCQRLGLKRSQNAWGLGKNEFHISSTDIKIESADILAGEERQEVFNVPFIGTVDECQKRMNDVLDLVEDKINLWWKTKQLVDGITVAAMMATLRTILEKARVLNVKKCDSREKANLIRLVESQLLKMNEYASAVPNPTPEQIEHEQPR